MSIARAQEPPPLTMRVTSYAAHHAPLAMHITQRAATQRAVRHAPRTTHHGANCQAPRNEPSAMRTGAARASTCSLPAPVHALLAPRRQSLAAERRWPPLDMSMDNKNVHELASENVQGKVDGLAATEHCASDRTQAPPARRRAPHSTPAACQEPPTAEPTARRHAPHTTPPATEPTARRRAQTAPAQRPPITAHKLRITGGSARLAEAGRILCRRLSLFLCWRIAQ